jgi:hypothetical protein
MFEPSLIPIWSRYGRSLAPRRASSRRITCRSSCRSVPSRTLLPKGARRSGPQFIADVRQREKAGNVRRFLASVMAITITAVAIAPSVLGCECADDKRPAKERIKALPPSAVIASGRAIKVEPSAGGPYGPYTTTFAVSRAWRNVNTPELLLFSNGGECDTGFKEGKEYLLIGHLEGSRVTVPPCSETLSLKQAGPLVQALGPPRYVPPPKQDPSIK